MNYEKELELFNEPIRYQQVIQIRRLAPDIPLSRIYTFTSDEASVFIKSIYKRYDRKGGWRLGTKEERAKEKERAKENRDQLESHTANTALSASLTIQALPARKVLIRISKKVAKI